MDPHRLAEDRSLAFHAAVAQRLLADPSVLTRARARVSSWLASGDVHVEYARAWEKVLLSTPSEISRAITEDSETARGLRQTTPFAGVIPPRERWTIWREVRRARDAAAR